MAVVRVIHLPVPLLRPGREVRARRLSQAGGRAGQLPSLLSSPGFLFSAVIVSSGVHKGLTSHLRVLFVRLAQMGCPFVRAVAANPSKRILAAALILFSFFRIPFFPR